MPQLHAFDSRDAMIEALAAHISERLRDAITRKGRAVMVLAGGETPKPLYRRLTQCDLDWANVIVTSSDERMVASSDPRSNEWSIRNALLRGKAETASFVPLSAGGLEAIPTPFDMVLLGIGKDGHTASLFPGSAGLKEALDPNCPPRCVTIIPDPLPPEAPFSRLTLTLPALLCTEESILLIAGEAKRRVYEQALGGVDVSAMPVRAVLHQTNVPVTVYWTS